MLLRCASRTRSAGSRPDDRGACENDRTEWGSAAAKKGFAVLYAFGFERVGVVVGDLYFVDPNPGKGQECPEHGGRVELRVLGRCGLKGSVYSRAADRGRCADLAGRPGCHAGHRWVPGGHRWPGRRGSLRRAGDRGRDRPAAGQGAVG